MASGTGHRPHVGDLVQDALNAEHVGVIYRTHEDNYTHSPEPLSQHQRGLERHDAIPPSDFGDFLASGAPPANTCLVVWSHDFSQSWADIATAELVPTSAIRTIERPMFIGDIVRKSPTDSMSGTVVAIDVAVSVTNPRPLKCPEPLTRPTLNMAGRVDNIPASDLIDTLGYTTGQVVIYKGWVGRIQEYLEAIHVLLEDGSVVELADPEDIVNTSFLGEDSTTVGDYITTKKGNLRRGHYLQGSYDPNISPSGYVVDVRIQEAEVRWFIDVGIARDPNAMPSEPPPASLLRDELESSGCVIYDRSRRPQTSRHSSRFPPVTNLDVGVGDKLRFRDLQQAKQKYPDIKSIDRSDSHGYDLNVFTVYRTRTMTTVLWQDLSISTHHALDLLPSSDLDDGNELWPGELAILKSSRHIAESFRLIPDGFGVVQSVATRDQLARVKWFEGYASFESDNRKIMHQDSWTGRLKGDDPNNDNSALTGGEDVSMYDMWSNSGLQRRVGDIVVLSPPANLAIPGNHERYRELHEALATPADQLNWLGEIVELSTHGWLVIRLGASTTSVRDIRVPWECTDLACGHEEEDAMPWLDDDLSDDDLDEDYDDEDDDDEDMGIAVSVPWMDENDEEVADGQEDWETDDETTQARDGDGDVRMDGSPAAPEPGPQLPTPAPASASIPIDSDGKFTYESMFAAADSPAQFAVLDGTPAEHHYLNQPTSTDTKRLRRIQKEYTILSSSLPPGVFVRSWEGNMSLMRILILGPLGTPYEYAPFLIDMHLGVDFPNQPPSAYFHSWTDGSGGVNPNLYEDGKICLSLLGTWPGDSNDDTWTSKSTVLQVIVSLLGLVLVNEPWYNEAGFEVRAGTAESKTPSALYSERVFLKSRSFIEKAITLAQSSQMAGFEGIVRQIYLDAPRELLRRAIAHVLGVTNRSLAAYKEGRDVYADAAKQERRLVSAGAVRSLISTTKKLFALRPARSEPIFDGLQAAFETVAATKAAVELDAPVARYIEQSGG